MTGDLPLFAQAIRRTFVFSGRARRTEVILYIFISQIACGLFALVASFVLDPTPLAWARFAIQSLAVVPLFTLTVRRLHDFGQRGLWVALLALVAGRSVGLDLATRLGGWEVRAMIERPLSYIDWVLFLPFVWLYIALLIVPGKKGANRFGPDPRDDPSTKTETAAPEIPGAAA